MIYEGFSFKEPDYSAVFQQRLDFYNNLRAHPERIPALKAYYRDHIPEFINDWGITFDPRNSDVNLPSMIPFVLFPRQREWIEWVLDHWLARRRGLAEKSRDCGLTWLAVAMSCALCVLRSGMVVGFGSRKADYVDLIGNPKSMLEKGRMFMRNLPTEFRAGWVEQSNSSFMRLTFPETGSLISGESGDGIGRGDRTSLYFVDEAAQIERPHLTEASLSNTTNCRIDISTARGMNNVFAQKRFEGKIDVFTFHWREDPRKDDAWYRKMCEEYDPVTVASEVDINYSASVEGVLIPSAWVQAALDAHRALGIAPTGARRAALDVADEGKDLNAFCGMRGPVVEVLEEWSGGGSDIFSTVRRAFDLCDVHMFDGFRYDADGLGAGVRGDARILNQGRRRALNVDAFRGSGAVHDPEGEDVKGRTNQDFFANAKAQAWWALRTRFQKTYRWVNDGEVSSFDDIISLPRGASNVMKLVLELSQPVYHVNPVGKIVVDKAPDGMRSPNLADALMIRLAPGTQRMKINPAALQRSRELGYHRMMA